METNSITAEHPDQKNHENMKNLERRNAERRRTQITKIIEKVERREELTRERVERRNIHVWRQREMVVASSKSLLQRGHVMHASSLSLLALTI